MQLIAFQKEDRKLESLSWNQRKYIFIGKGGGEALSFFYENLLCGNYKV